MKDASVATLQSLFEMFTPLSLCALFPSSFAIDDHTVCVRPLARQACCQSFPLLLREMEFLHLLKLSDRDFSPPS